MVYHIKSAKKRTIGCGFQILELSSVLQTSLWIVIISVQQIALLGITLILQNSRALITIKPFLAKCFFYIEFSVRYKVKEGDCNLL